MLSSTSKYALRVLVALEGEPRGAFVVGRVLAERTWIPANYLSKILLALRNAGIIKTERGHGGGYQLALEPDQIKLIDVIEVFEGLRSSPSCLLGIHEVCSDENPCSAHASFRDMRRAYVEFFEKTSIADAARMEQPLIEAASGSGEKLNRRNA